MHSGMESYSRKATGTRCCCRRWRRNSDGMSAKLWRRCAGRPGYRRMRGATRTRGCRFLPRSILRSKHVGEPLRVRGHRDVVKETIRRRFTATALLHTLQLDVGEAMPDSGRAVEPVILEFRARGRQRLERVDHVHEVEFPAQFGDERGVPIAARLPTHERIAAFGSFEKSA